ncbi:hypothetical protein JCM10207_004662 [Rhodosporidiobolus poonsookiae]
MLLPSVLLALAASGALAAPASSSASSTATSASSASSAGSYPYLTADGYTDAKWIKAFEKAKGIVAGLTLYEKVNFTALRADTLDCSGSTYPLPAAGIDVGLCFSDGPTGLRTLNSRYSTQFPTQLTTAATWNRELITARGEAMAVEYKESGAHVPLAIVAGPIGRSVYGGRNWEGWMPDAWFQGEATKLTVEAFQRNKVNGLVKHFYGNEQENLRSGSTENETVNSIIDAATERETYAWPFAEGARSGMGSVMCSYQLINGTYACENDAALNQLLKDELNFGAFVVTDWGAGHHTLGTALNGTDNVQTYGGPNVWGESLSAVIENGTVPESILDDKIVRILTPYFALDQGSLPSFDLNRYVARPAHTKIVRNIAEESITLVKNNRDGKRGLPLSKPRNIALVGSPAGRGRYGMLDNLGFLTQNNRTDHWMPGPLTDGFGSGAHSTINVVDPLMGLTLRAQQDDEPAIVDAYAANDPYEVPLVNPYAGSSALPGQDGSSWIDTHLDTADAALVFVSASATEGADRFELTVADGGDNLIAYVAQRFNNTIVVVTSPGPIDASAWIDHTNVTAVLFNYLPTSQGGRALASIVYGDITPSGKLPWAVARNTSDYPVNLYNGTAGPDAVTEFTEGNFIDYKWWDANTDKELLFEFGFGLSYTNFSFSDLKVSQTKKANKALVRETNEKFFATGKLSSGLYDTAFTVKATVKNTGSVAGAEVVQLYLSFPDSTPRQMPVRSLRGFSKPSLKAGESKTVSFELRNKDLAYYDVVSVGWKVPEGEFTVSVGSSSRKLPLTGKLTV